MIEVGTVIAGKLRVERLLGRGGMGVVVVATHLQLGQLVAVKVLRDELGSDRVTVERFLREGQASARLRSEHVCRVFDVGTLASGAPYLVMELLDGADLGSVIAQGPLSIAQAVDHVLQACEAIAEAHAAGIIHRDLKPANLFACRRFDGGTTIKVLDFGIAKAGGPDDLQLTQTAAMMGSPAFMSPEQLRSARDVDARTDIWALGAILYQCVSGRLPFPASSVTELTAKVLLEPPQPLGVDPRFDAIVMRCLEKDPARRYPSVAALAQELATCGGATAPGLARAVSSAQSAISLASVGTMATAAPGSSPGTVWTVPPPPPSSLHAAPPTVAPPSRRPLYILGGIAVAGIAVAAIASSRGGGGATRKPDDVPAAQEAQRANVSQHAGEFGRAMFDHRCADALAAAQALGQAALVAEAETCVPLKAKLYPRTRDGMRAAQAARDLPQALAIAEQLLAKQPSDPSLITFAGITACETRAKDKARLYVPKIADADLRATIIEQCRQLGVTID